MCGICGTCDLGPGVPADPAVIEAMTARLVHRGPDDSGAYVRGPIGLGFRRLSIIDLEGGHQPMERAGIWIVFNGEVYNFRELRSELEQEGIVFTTRSDTEVILQGYRRWGMEVLARLRGMFGLAIWDDAAGRLLLARDAMGIKPLYYTVADGRLVFASELRALWPALPARPAVDRIALNHFLRYRYTPAPRTIFSGISKLAPGERLVAENGAHRIERWYSIPGTKGRPGGPGREADDSAVEALLERYRAALARHLISDVPVGLLLSGGVDSALLLALMSEQRPEWPTFTVGYGESFADDELVDAEETARHFGARHVSVRIDQAMFQAELPRIVESLEEPIASSSIVPMYFVCRRAREDVKVALVGQGPDELFGGYTRHLGVRYGGAWRALPSPLRGFLGGVLPRVSRNAALRRGLDSLDQPDRLRRFQQVFSLLPGSRVDGLFREGTLPAGTGDEVLPFWSRLARDPDELRAFQSIELWSALPDELLLYADKLSMTHGLELRVPYLDTDLVEEALVLPADMKIRRGVRKWIHRRVGSAFLPPAVLRRKKRGFAVNVVDRWFREETTGEALRDPASSLYEYIRFEAVQSLLAEHVAGRQDHHKLLFSLVVFERWLEGPGRW